MNIIVQNELLRQNKVPKIHKKSFVLQSLNNVKIGEGGPKLVIALEKLV